MGKQQIKQPETGYTLIELMIVVAIIGVLASISLPLYSDYQNKSKMSAGFAEISGAKIQFSLLLSRGEIPTLALMTTIKQQTTEHCNITITSETITCTIVNASAQIQNAKLTWTYNPLSKDWTCKSENISGDSSLAPKNCPV